MAKQKTKKQSKKVNENLIYELQNSDNVEAAWSNEGKIFAQIQPSGAIIRIFHDTDLTNSVYLCCQRLHFFFHR
jgi:hypothetical protein